MTHTDPDATLLDTQTAMQHVESETAQLEDVIALMKQICGGLAPHTYTPDRDILCVCLHHLFLSIDTLFQVACQTSSEQVFTVESQSASMWQLKQQCTTWMYLREIKQALERVEPLCQLLNNASMAILISLGLPDDDDSPEGTELLETIPGTPDTSFAMHLYCEQFHDALTSVLDIWQQSLAQQFTFRYRFAHLLSATPQMTQLDSALSSLFDNAKSLFRDSLPALSIADNLDEIAALFLDVMQQVDQILLQIDLMMAPLHVLIKQFALGAEMR
jgi:hypothetical protein